MNCFTFLQRLGFAGAFFVGFTHIGQSATIRVPEDFDKIQRAISVAAPGDTIVIAPGTYSENLRLTETVTVRGAGIGKTTIIAPERQRPIVLVETGGTVTLTDLTLCHAPALPDVKEPEVASFALEFRGAPVVLRNIRAEKPAGYLLQSSHNVLTAENVSLSSTNSYCVLLTWTKPGTQLTNLKIDPSISGAPISIDNGAAVFKDIDPGLTEKAEIFVSGPLSDVKFVNLPPSLQEKVRWSEASPDGPVTDKITEYERVNMEEAKETAVALKEYRDQIRAKEPARRALLRDLQNKLRSAKTSADAVSALGTFLPALYGTILDPENGFHDENLETIIRAELRAIYARFGIEGITLALELPHSDKNTLAFYSSSYLSFDLRESLESYKTQQWLKTNLPDLPAILASWKKEPASEPAAAADAFLAMLDGIATKSTSGDAKAKSALRNLALEELPPFIAKRGTAALDRLLRKLALAPTSLVTVDDARSAVPTEHTVALIRFWKTTP